MAELPKLYLQEHFASGSDKGTVVEVCQTPFRIGREPDNEMQIPERQISANHAELRFETGRWWVYDCASRNGTVLNGRRVQPKAVLHDDDDLAFAHRNYRVRFDLGSWQKFTTLTADDAAISQYYELLNVLRNRLTLPVFQPIVQIATGETVGWESLGRVKTTHQSMDISTLFRLADLGKADARLSGQFREVTQFCVHCHKCWPETQQALLFINLRSSELDEEDLVGVNKLAEFCAPAVRKAFQVVVEIPETWGANSSRIRSRMDLLRKHGLLVAFDDYGGGLDHTVELYKVAPDFVKFDRKWVVSLDDKEARSLIQPHVDMCRQLKIRTLAEGIETAEQRSVCLDMGIELGQGYLWGAPKSAYTLFNRNPATLPPECPFVELKIVSASHKTD